MKDENKIILNNYYGIEANNMKREKIKSSYKSWLYILLTVLDYCVIYADTDSIKHE